MIITIEGCSGSGKSTLKERLSEHYRLVSYQPYGFYPLPITKLPINLQNAAFIFCDIFKGDSVTRNIERLLVAKTAMQLWEDNIIVDLFLTRCIFFDIEEAQAFSDYLTYAADMLPTASIFLDVSYDTQMERLLRRENENMEHVEARTLPYKTHDSTPENRKTFRLLSQTLPYPIITIDGNKSADDVFDAAVQRIDNL